MASGTGPNRDAELLSRWVGEHGGAVRAFLLGLVRRPDVADDLLQEVFRRAWQARHRYQEQGRASGPTCCGLPIGWCATGAGG